MPPNPASSLPPSRTSPPRVSPPRATPSRISPPRISPPQLNANRVCSGNHTRLEEEEMAQVKRAIPVTKVSPPSPTPTRQPAAQETENVPPPTQTQEGPVIENVVVDDRNALPRNTAVVFNHLAPRDENIPTQQPRQPMATGKNKVKFSISCVTVSTASSEQESDTQHESDTQNEDDALDPFAPPALVPSVTVAPQQQSLLTQSLRKHSHVFEAESSAARTADQGANSSQSRAPDRSTETAQTAGRSNWVDPALIRERDILIYGPFQRVKGKRYYDEPLPTKSSKPNPLPLLKPFKPTAPPFPAEPSLPGLTPSSVAIPARVGRAPNRPAVDRPPPDRPPPDRPLQQTRQPKVQPPKVQPPKQANVTRRMPEPPTGQIKVRPEGSCSASQICHQPALVSAGSYFCRFHCCYAILADGNRCPNQALRPTFDEKLPTFCKRGYHKENNTYGQIDLERRRGVVTAGRKKLQEESDLEWYAKVVAIVLPQEQPDIKVTPELFEELFYPDSDDEDSDPKTKARRKRREAGLTGIANDTSVRPVRKFLTLEHIMAHPKLKKPPQVILTAEQEAHFLREAEGGLLPRTTPTPVEEPKVAPKLMYTLPPPIRFVNQQPNSETPEWMFAVGFKKRKEKL